MAVTRRRLLWILPESISLLALAVWGIFLAYNVQTGLLSGNGAWERLWAVTVGMGAVYLFLGWGALCPGYFAGRALARSFLPPRKRRGNGLCG